MADEAKVTLSGDNKPLLDAVAQSRKVLEDFVRQYDDGQKKNTKATSDFSQSLEQLSQLFGSTFGSGVVQTIQQVTMALQGNAAAATALGGKVATELVGQYKAAMKIFEEAEIAAVRLQYALEKIGEGASFNKLDEFATKMETRSIFGKNEEIIGALQATTKFKTITQDMRKDLVELAGDIASMEGTSIKGVAESLSRALDSPMQGLRLLRQFGVQFTEDQKDLVKHLEETGRHAEAQGIIIEELAAKYAGATGVIADTQEGTWKKLENQFGQLQEKIASELSPAITYLQEQLLRLITIGQDLANMSWWNTLFGSDSSHAASRTDQMIKEKFGQDALDKANASAGLDNGNTIKNGIERRTDGSIVKKWEDSVIEWGIDKISSFIVNEMDSSVNGRGIDPTGISQMLGTQTPEEIARIQERQRMDDLLAGKGAPAAAAIDEGKYGLRPDGTKKARGFLGEIRSDAGDVMTEYSVGMKIGGKEMDVPSLIPGLTDDEIAVIKAEGEFTEDMLKKIQEHAEDRVSAGKSPFASDQESLTIEMRGEEARTAENKAWEKSLVQTRQHNEDELKIWEKQVADIQKQAEARVKVIVESIEREEVAEEKAREKKIQALERSGEKQKKEAERAIRQAVKDSDFTATFRGLEDQFKSVQAAAASRTTPEEDIKKEIEKSNAKIDKEIELQQQQLQTLELLPSILGEIRDSGGMV